MSLITKIFGTRSQREIKKIQPMVDKILGMEAEYKALSEEDLKAKTQQFKTRLDQGETLDSLLPEAFAAIREVGMRPFPVQLMGGIILHQGRIAEMKTGEGKTLVAILPCYLNALNGRGVHFVAVLQSQNFIHRGLDFLQLPLGAGAEQFLNKSHCNLLL